MRIRVVPVVSLLIVALISLQGVAGVSLPAVGSAEATVETPMEASVAAVFADPWWPEWLAYHDQDGDGVDDALVQTAQDLVSGGTPDAGLAAIVTFGHPVGPADVEALAALPGLVVHEFRWIPAVEVIVPAHAVGGIAWPDGVVAVEWDRPMEPTLDVSAPATQALDKRGGGGPYDGKTAQALGYDGSGMVVAVIDTGVQQDHEAFGDKRIAGAVTSLTGSYYLDRPEDLGVQRSAVIPCADTDDDGGHGTHVAGTAVGNPPDGVHRGTAPGADLVEIKIDVGGVSGVSGTILFPFVLGGGDDIAHEWVLDFNQAIDAGTPMCGVTVDDRIDVATMSFGTDGAGGPNAGSMEGILQALVENGVVSTIAAGNVGGSEFTVASPGNAAATISVANSNDKNTIDRSDDSLAGSSSRGPNQGTATGLSNLVDRYRKPDLAAPGTNIVAPNTFEGIWEKYTSGILGAPEYVSFSGTSMATPHVAGIAALLLQAGEQVRSQTGGVNVMAPTGDGYASGAYAAGEHPVRDALIHGAQYMSAGVSAAQLSKWEATSGAGITWNNGYGYGHVDAFASLCYAWETFLEPAGATVPAGISVSCAFGPAPDSDGDGVPDGQDVCPGFDDTLDGDGDGVPDGCDAFPADPAESQDSDGDGVGDNSDVCPGGDDTVDSDGDGTPDACETGVAATTIYLHAGATAVGNVDQLFVEQSPMDENPPVFTDPALAMDVSTHSTSSRPDNIFEVRWISTDTYTLKDQDVDVALHIQAANPISLFCPTVDYDLELWFGDGRSFGNEHRTTAPLPVLLPGDESVLEGTFENVTGSGRVAFAVTSASLDCGAGIVMKYDAVDFPSRLEIQPAALADADGDGVPDGQDVCPGHDDNADRDADGVPDGCDAFPDDGSEWNDSDGDGVGDNSDACPGSDDGADLDGDGTPDGCDADRDGDGVPDDVDNCPNVANAGQEDVDGDGTGDACDAQDNRDSDGDGVENWEDACAGYPDGYDHDGDGVPDGCDPDADDKDGDGIDTHADNCPGHANVGQEDMDGDGRGDVCDPDRDGDGYTNRQENAQGSDSDDPASTP